MTADNKGKRQSFPDTFKRAVVAETFEPGATVTAVAGRHGLKPNLVFTWRTIERLLASAPASMFLPVEVAVPAADCDRANTPPVDPVDDLSGRAVVIAMSGMSMINAAMTAQAVIDHFVVEHLVFTGIAGGIDPEVHVGDVVVPDRWAQSLEVIFGRATQAGFEKPGWLT